MIYKVKPIINYNEEIVLPNCMYRVKKIDENLLVDIGVTKDLKIKQQVARFLQQNPSNKMIDLDKRQKKILQQLDTLNELINKLKKACKASPIIESNSNQLQIPNELVIHVSSEYLPYYLLAIQKDLNVSYHIHSSTKTDHVINVKGFMKLFKNNDKHGINVTLIFMDVSTNSELILPSITPSLIRGEVNILRYLSFLIPNTLEYSETFQTDSMLDACYMIQRSYNNVKILKESLELLFKSLGKSWLCGDGISVVDIAAYSLVKQINAVDKILPAKAKPWLEKCKRIF